MDVDEARAEGARAFHAYRTSRHTAQFVSVDKVDVREAMRMFMPTWEQPALQMATPLPLTHAAWCEGFEEARSAWRAEPSAEPAAPPQSEE